MDDLLAQQIPFEVKSNQSALNGGVPPQIQSIPVGDVMVISSQARSITNSAKDVELLASVIELGVLQPIAVSPCVGGKYPMIFGHRRLNAAIQAGHAVIPAMIFPASNKSLIQVIENIHREDLNNRDVMESVHQLRSGMNDAAIMQVFGWSSDKMRRVCRLWEAPETILRLLKNNTCFRAAYDLNLQHQKTPALTEAALCSVTNISYAEARKMISAMQIPSTNTTSGDSDEVQNRESGEDDQNAAVEDEESYPYNSSEDDADHECGGIADKESVVHEGLGTRAHAGRGRSALKPTKGKFREKADPEEYLAVPRSNVSVAARVGILVTERAAKEDGHALVRFGDRTETSFHFREIKLIGVDVV